jgi:glycosyltransferase involved in cell wall biosynthesis
MIYLACFIFIFSVVQLMVATANLVFKEGFAKTKRNFKGLVSVLIPARDEESNIALLIKDLKEQDYQNIEIIVFNDLSTDKTAHVVLELSKTDHRITLVNSGGLPNGWLGKNFACHSLSKHAKGAYFLFLDADVRIYKDIIANTVAFSEKYKLGLLSIFPTQIMITTGERITVPNMNYILLSLLPLILVRKSKNQSLAAANGQYMLFDSAKYLETFPHEKMKDNRVEDIEIARYFKRNNIKIACLTGFNTIKCRMYQGFGDAVNGFSKNVITFFGNSFGLAILFWLINTFGFLVVLFSLSLPSLMLYLLAILLTRIIISIISKQMIWDNLFFLVPQQIALGLFICKAVINKYKKQYEWKGRSIM